jgi:hypothetical protein
MVSLRNTVALSPTLCRLFCVLVAVGMEREGKPTSNHPCEQLYGSIDNFAWVPSNVEFAVLHTRSHSPPICLSIVDYNLGLQ